ncbi:hypothetical protein ER308_00260 [Egibacter rhizosphaerae]|uniref:ABC-type glycine betaine transport system substrate-binding domain-containing protein n=1 Tax=Egibacter rhizosphaerae TaxID=1670831 RepID=A0A411YAF6_9ACTN|nr:glycine betaine ABC transporter substrate-binding protein [Egibacter rhizosphaerae]QBI18157.1 hypothetical protein ER308_00260 [Egibacter rhizosphaerae]
MRLRLLTGAVVLLGAAGCGLSSAAQSEPVTVGVGALGEQQVLAALTVEALERAEVPVERSDELGTTVGLRREAARDRVDLYWDYTGAAWSRGMREPAPPADPIESWERVREADRRNGLLWLEPTDADATFALFVREGSRPNPEAGMSWLAGELSGGERTLCADADFIERPGGLDALADEYAIDLTRLSQQPMSEEEAIAGVASGTCFAGLATATSGAAHAEGLVPVADDLSVFPSFLVAPVARQGSPADRGEIREVLEPLVDALDSATLRRLNAEHEGGEAPDELAERFLDELDELEESPDDAELDGSPDDG